MPLHINLLHEEQSKVVERKRDPLKLGILAILFLSICFAGYYMVRASHSSKVAKERADLKSQLDTLQPNADHAKIDVATATQSMAATTAVEKLINDRFYWGPLLSQIAQSTGPEIQIVGIEGTVRGVEGVNFTVVGVSAGREPRAVAERFRQSLEEDLRGSYGTVSSQFASLENSAAPLILNGKSFATAKFSIAFQLTLKKK